MLTASFVLLAIASIAAADKPPIDDKVGTARWIVANARWASIATIYRKAAHRPFANIISTANATFGPDEQGVPVFYTSPMDSSSKDIAVNNNVSISFSEAELGLCGEKGNWSKPDPEDPLCARLSLSGRFVQLSGSDADSAKKQLFAVHPEMAQWPASHDWMVSRLYLDEVWLIDVFGGAAIVPPEVYYSYNPKW